MGLSEEFSEGLLMKKRKFPMGKSPRLAAPLSIGGTIHVRGQTTDLIERVESLQIEHASVAQAREGDSVGAKVTDKCRKGRLPVQEDSMSTAG